MWECAGRAITVRRQEDLAAGQLPGGQRIAVNTLVSQHCY